VDLKFTAIRSFAMKRLAIMHGSVDPFTDIALFNERRDLMLKFLLKPEQLNNKVKIAFVDATVICTSINQTVPLLPYTLFFSSEHIYDGATDRKGVIAYDDLPVGPYILTINNPKFIIIASDEVTDQSNAPIDPATTKYAKSILKDLSNKVPVVKAWLEHDAANETDGTQRIARHLTTIGVSANGAFTNELRQQCMSILGIGASHREPFRTNTTVRVSCPKPVTRGGCLLAIVNLALGLLKKK